MVGLAVLRRTGGRTIIYCRADQIAPEVARSLSEQGTRFSGSTVRYDHPVSPALRVRFERLDPDEMPGDSAHVSALREGKAIAYFRADMITEEMAQALELICAEETRYFIRLPVISPAVPASSPPAS